MTAIRLLLTLLLACPVALWAQEGDSVEVRVFGAEGVDEATALWVDAMGCVLAGETTSDITMAPGQAAWTSGGPVGRKGFLAVMDTALDHQWSYAFAGDVEAPVGAPSAVSVNAVTRTADSTAWVLYDAPRTGQWRGHLLGIHPDDGPVAEFDLGAAGSTTTCALTPAGGSSFIVVGNHWPNAAPSNLPAGIMLGLWPGDALTAPGWAPLADAQGMEAIAADWWNDTLYIAAHRPDHPDAPAAVLMVTADNGNPFWVGTAPIADPALTLTGITAGPLGVAWSGTLTATDGTLNATYGKLSAAPDALDPAVWSHEWIVVTQSDQDRPGRAILWTGTILQCAGRTTTAGAGGAGAMVQRRFGETGAWFGVHTFGGEADEDVRALGLDDNGRVYVAGSSNSWTGLTANNGSADAVLFRSTTTELIPGLPYAAAAPLLTVDQTFVGIHDMNGQVQQQRRDVICLPSGASMPVQPGDQWVLFDAAGRSVARGEGRGPVPHFSGWLRLERVNREAASSWIWVLQ